jgi:hypothetical protein
MTDLAVSVAGLQTLGAGLSLEVAHEADALGFVAWWVRGVEPNQLLEELDGCQ